MPLSRFTFPTAILFGAGALDELPAELAKRGMSRPLVVTDAGLAAMPVFERLLKLAGETAAVFSSVDPNPTERNVLNGVRCYMDNRCDGIIGFGGGSPLDAAKAIRLKVTHQSLLEEYDDLTNGSDRITSNMPPYIAVATTSGTGSEVSRSAVITVERTNRKTVIFSPFLIPGLALADPELTVQMPRHLTAGTGMDAFTHNVEAYLAKGYNPVCDAIALQGAKLVWDNLPRAMEAPEDLQARTNMMMASIMGAIAFQKGLGAVHSLAHPLSSDCGMHHGTTNAILLPAVLEYNRAAVSERLAELAALLGGADLVEMVRDLNCRIGIKPRLQDWGVTEDILPQLADKAVQDGCHQLNPRPCSREDLLQLYKATY